MVTNVCGYCNFSDLIIFTKLVPISNIIVHTSKQARPKIELVIESTKMNMPTKFPAKIMGCHSLQAQI